MKLIIFHIVYFFFSQQLFEIINFSKIYNTISFDQQNIDISIFVFYTKNTKNMLFQSRTVPEISHLLHDAQHLNPHTVSWNSEIIEQHVQWAVNVQKCPLLFKTRAAEAEYSNSRVVTILLLVKSTQTGYRSISQTFCDYN